MKNIINTVKSIRYRIERLNNRTGAEKVFEGMLKRFKREFKNLSYVPERIFYMKDGGFYFADFYIEKPYHLIFEIDGGYHLDRKVIQHDVNRTMYFECDRGIKVYRFNNQEIFENYRNIKQKVREILKNHLYHPIPENPDYNEIKTIETQFDWMPEIEREKEVCDINQMLDNSFSMTV